MTPTASSVRFGRFVQNVVRAVLALIALGTIALPIVLFYRGFGPPLVPVAAWVTAIVALLVAALGFVSTRPVRARRARCTGLAGLLLLAVYGIGLSRWTVAPPVPQVGERVQVGFAMARWALTDKAIQIVDDAELGVRDPQELLLAFGGFTEGTGRPDDAWAFWSILAAGLILVASLFVGVLLIADAAGRLLRFHVEPAALLRGGNVAGTRPFGEQGASPAPTAAGSGAGKRKLLVIVPGIDGRLEQWDPLVERLAVEPRLSGTCVLAHDHEARVLGRGSLRNLATQLRARLDCEWAKAASSGGFDEVILVGHSIGGLLVREAYLQKCELGARDPQGLGWSAATQRILLLACPNRGLNPERDWRLRILDWVFRMLPFARRSVLYDLMRGSCFVTSLRIRWIQHFHRLGATAPLVVQMIGASEEYIVRGGNPEEDDCADVEQSSRAWHITIPGAKHGDLPHVIGTGEDAGSYARFLEGLLEESLSDAENRDIRGAAEVFFVLHGIRANNVGWVEKAKSKIRDRCAGALIHAPGYDRLSALKFALPLTRKRKTRWFQDRYAESLAENPDAKFHFLGHSNGTYLLGASLRDVPGMKFERVALVGSVLPCNFQWGPHRRAGRVNRIRNDRSTADVPVAILCSALRGLWMHDVGLAGVHGFQDQNDTDIHEVFWHEGGHSRPLEDTELDDLVEFLASGEVRKPTALVGKLDWRFALLSRAAALLALPSVLVLGALLVWWIGYGEAFELSRLLWVVGTSVVVVVLLDLL